MYVHSGSTHLSPASSGNLDEPATRSAEFGEPATPSTKFDEPTASSAYPVEPTTCCHGSSSACYQAQGWPEAQGDAGKRSQICARTWMGGEGDTRDDQTSIHLRLREYPAPVSVYQTYKGVYRAPLSLSAHDILICGSRSAFKRSRLSDIAVKG